MKVAIDTSPLLKGHKYRGIGAYTKNLINEFKKNDFDIEFSFFQKNPPKDVEIVHYPYFDLFFHTLPFFKKSKITIVTIHDLIPLVFPEFFPPGPKGKMNLFFQKFSLKRVNYIICDSESSRRDVIRLLGISPSKVRAVYLAPNSIFKKISQKDHLTKIKKRYSLPQKFALYVGDVNRNKNLSNLLESIRIANVPLVMVGKALVDKELSQSRDLEKKIRDLKIEKLVIKTGFIPENDLASIYSLASMTLLPSLYEGFGLPVLESMACGIPVVCSKNSSLIEIGGDAAFFCEPTSPPNIAKKIKEIINLNDQERNFLSKKCIAQANKFNWTKTALQTVAVYKLFDKI